MKAPPDRLSNAHGVDACSSGTQVAISLLVVLDHQGAQAEQPAAHQPMDFVRVVEQVDNPLTGGLRLFDSAKVRVDEAACEECRSEIGRRRDLSVSCIAWVA